MTDIWRKYKRHTERKHLIQSWACSRCSHCRLTLIIPLSADRFLLQALVIFLPLDILWSSFFENVHPMLREGWKYNQDNGLFPRKSSSQAMREESCCIHIPASSSLRWDSEAFSMQFLRDSQHDWAPGSHSDNLLINFPCISFLTSPTPHFSTSVLYPGFTSQRNCLNASPHFMVFLGKLNLRQVVNFICMFALRSIPYLLPDLLCISGN